MRAFLCFIFLITFVCLSDSANIRCGKYIISEGDTKFEVLEKCGELDSKEVEGYVTKGGDSGLGIKQEVWIYKRKNRYYKLEFYGTELKSILPFTY